MVAMVQASEQFRRGDRIVTEWDETIDAAISRAMTPEEKVKLRAFARANDFEDLIGAEFLRLLNLAHSEGLLSVLLKIDAPPILRPVSQAAGLPTVPVVLETPSLL